MNALPALEKEEKPFLVEKARRPVNTARSTFIPSRQMFSDSLLELSRTERRRRKGAALFSFLVQGLIVAVLILLPLWFTDVLPAQQLVTFLVAPPPPPPPPAPAPPMKAVKMVSQIVNGQLLAPSKIPKAVKMIKEEEAPPPATGVAGGVVGGVPGGQPGGVIGSLISTANRTSTATAPKPSEIPKRLIVSQGVSLGMLQSQVEPVYPMIAKRARVQGTVTLRAVISAHGTIESLQVIDGHAMLVTAAMDAVKQWRYKPYMLSGQPVEVETTVFVNFHIDR
ncbi:MAG TPA: TonB family protein [Candidatus Angelobacter sp.]|nr:TonB family protein [Candidatus Angelobacter sp.]